MFKTRKGTLLACQSDSLLSWQMALETKNATKQIERKTRTTESDLTFIVLTDIFCHHCCNSVMGLKHYKTQAGEEQSLPFFVAALRLGPSLIRASRVLPSTPTLFHNVEWHFLEGQFGGLSVFGIHLSPQTSQTDPSNRNTPQKVYPADHPEPRISCQSNHPLAVTAQKPFRASGARRVQCAKTPVCPEIRGHDRLRRMLRRYRPRRTAKIGVPHAE